MGLKKLKELETGFSADHFTIRNVFYDVKTGQINMMVEIYKDKLSFDGGLLPVSQKSYSLNFSDLGGTKKLVPALYDWLKALPGFDESVEE